MNSLKKSHNGRKFARFCHPACQAGLPDFSWSKRNKLGKNDHKLYQPVINYTYQMDKKIPNIQKIYIHFQFQGLQKFTQIGIFGLKMNHLATLAPSTSMI
jgi:hypothetical protein